MNVSSSKLQKMVLHFHQGVILYVVLFFGGYLFQNLSIGKLFSMFSNAVFFVVFVYGIVLLRQLLINKTSDKVLFIVPTLILLYFIIGFLLGFYIELSKNPLTHVLPFIEYLWISIFVVGFIISAYVVKKIKI